MGSKSLKLCFRRAAMMLLVAMLTLTTAWAKKTNPKIELSSGPTYGKKGETTSLTLKLWYWNYDGGNAHFRGDVYLSIDGEDCLNLSDMWTLFTIGEEHHVKDLDDWNTHGDKGYIVKKRKVDWTYLKDTIGTAQFKNPSKKQGGTGVNDGKWCTIKLDLNFNDQFSYYGHEIDIHGNWSDYCDKDAQCVTEKHLKVTIPGCPRVKSLNLTSSDHLNPVVLTWESETYNSDVNTKGNWWIFRNDEHIATVKYGTKKYTDNIKKLKSGYNEFRYVVSWCPQDVEIYSDYYSTSAIGLADGYSFAVMVHSLPLSTITDLNLINTKPYFSNDGIDWYKKGQTITFAPKNAYHIIDKVSDISGSSVSIAANKRSFSFSMPKYDVRSISATLSEVHTVSVPSGFTLSDPYITINGTKYYKSGESYTLTPTDKTKNMLSSCSASGATISNVTAGGATLTINKNLNGNVTVSATTTAIYGVSLANGVSINSPTPVATYDGVKYFKSGTKITLGFDNSVLKSYERFTCFTKDGKDLSGNTFTMSTSGVSIGYKAETLYSISFYNGTSTTTAATKTFNGQKFWASGTPIYLSCNVPADKLLDFYTVNNAKISGSSFSMSARNTTVGASFIQLYTISAANGITVSATAAKTGYYKSGTQVTLSFDESVLEDNQRFDHYTVNGEAITGNTFTVPTGNVTIGYETVQLYTISLEANPSQGGAVKGEGQYIEGETVTVTATANDKYKFVKWTDKNGETLSEEASYTFTVQSDLSLTAVFEKEAYNLIAGTEGLKFKNSAGNIVTVAHAGETVVVIMTGVKVPDDKYVTEIVTDVDGVTIKLNDEYTGTFIMPENDVTVSMTLGDASLFVVDLTGNSPKSMNSDLLNNTEDLMGYLNFQNNNTGEIIPFFDLMYDIIYRGKAEDFNNADYNLQFDFNLDGKIDAIASFSGSVMTFAHSAGTDLLTSNFYMETDRETIHSPYNGIMFKFGNNYEEKELERLIPLANNSKYNIFLMQMLLEFDEETEDSTDPILCPFPVVLQERKLYKDGDWNTLYLPFDVDLTDLACPLYGAEARTMESATLEGETLKLTFGNPVETLKAGVPYIIKWSAGSSEGTEETEGSEYILNPIFRNVIVKNERHPFYGDYIEFSGNYDKFTVDKEDQNFLFLGANNKLYYPDGNAPTNLGACRAYFYLGGGEAPQFRNIVLDFGEGETVSIENVTLHEDENGNLWFSLDGQQLSDKSRQRGLYINNHKKVLNK